MLPPNLTGGLCEISLGQRRPARAQSADAVKSGRRIGANAIRSEQDRLSYRAIARKVFTPAESAEAVAWDLLRRYQAELPNLKAAYPGKLGTSVASASEFVARINANEVIARTHLTFGWRYKERLVRKSCAMRIKDAAFRQSLPRFVWVTEFGTRASFNTLDKSTLQVFSHAVTDATSNMLWGVVACFMRRVSCGAGITIRTRRSEILSIP